MKTNPALVAFVVLVGLMLACESETIEGAVMTGQDALTADAATEAALDTEVASGAIEITVEILEVSIDSRTCSLHANTTDGYDCSYTATFSLAYENPSWSRIQCFFSNSESDKVNAEPGAGQLTITITHEDLVFSPGTTFNGFCQMRDQETDEVLAQFGNAASGWDIAVIAP